MPKDLFSKQHASYAKYRPSYPKALIDYVMSYVENKQMAWDCATGNGQAALPLAEHFANVVATDLSEKQLAMAEARANIQYIRSEAEHTSFPENTFDLITVADGNAIISLYDSYGRTVREFKASVLKGYNHVILDQIKGFNAGSYYLRVAVNNEILNRKVVKY